MLVPGWFDTAEALRPLARGLEKAGWPPDWILRTRFDSATGSNIAHAEELAEQAAELLARTGMPCLDVIAHSMGGLAVRHWLRFGGGSGRVGRVLFLATPHRGTWAAWLAWGAGGREMRPGSDFLRRLNAGRAVPEGVEAVTLQTPFDLHVLPPARGRVEGVPSGRVWCLGHPRLIRHRPTLAHLVRLLSDRERSADHPEGEGAPEDA